jgi:hypothetical protein
MRAIAILSKRLTVIGDEEIAALRRYWRGREGIFSRMQGRYSWFDLRQADARLASKRITLAAAT